jgi:cobalt-zinc-cadmium efflux system outer membrane protein
MLALLMVMLQVPQAHDSLAVDAAIRLALARRGVVGAAAARVSQARSALRQSGAIPNPVARWSYTDDPPREHATAEQPLDWLLVRGPARGAARADVEGALADSAQAAANVAADVRGAFYRALRAEAGLAQAAGQRALADSVVRIADQRLRAGDISQYERDQVALEAARAGLAVSEAREALRAARADLARALALSPEQALPALSGRLDAALAAGEPAALDRVPETVRVAESDSASAALRARAAGRGRIPLPSVEAGAEWSDPGAPGRTLAVIGLALPFPLWQTGGAEQAVATGRAAEAAARLREARGEFLAQQGAAAARVAETAARALALRDTLVPAAADLRRRATLAYAAGETGVLPVLDALRSERELNGNLLDGLLAWQLAVAEWNRLHGRAE